MYSYKFFADYHTHTINSVNNFSITDNHGYGTIEENALVADFRGFTEIGITDHGYKHFMFGINPKEDHFKQIREEIDILNDKFKNRNLKILFGLECNIISYDGEIDIKDYMLDYVDYVNAGIHEGSGILTFDMLSNKIIKNNHKFLEATQNALNKNAQIIKILTHPDEVIKFTKEEMIEIGKSAIKNDVALEINSSHEPLSIEYLKELDKLGVMFSVGSDAHTPEKVGNFTRALEKIKTAQINPSKIINCNTESMNKKASDCNYIIFINGNGVLYDKIDKEYVFRPLDKLKKIVEEKNAKIIIAASYRRKPNGKKDIEKHLEKYGLIDNLLGYTIKKNKSSRAKKIKSWKDNLGSSYTYEVIK